MDTPQYPVEDNAVFLGRFSFTTPNNTQHDVDLYYFHDNGFGKPTIMSRWGKYGPENSTGMAFGWSGLSADLVEARRRAEKLGLDVEREYYHPNNMPERGHVVYYNGKLHTFQGINPSLDGMSATIKEGFPPYCGQPDRRNFLMAPLAEITDLDNEPIRWCQQIN